MESMETGLSAPSVSEASGSPATRATIKLSAFVGSAMTALAAGVGAADSGCAKVGAAVKASGVGRLAAK